MNPITDVNPIEQMLVERASRMRLPIACTLELTPLCNFNCRMCYVRLSGEELRERGRLLHGGEWLRIAEEMKTAGVLFVLLTGGEPLLHPDFREIYRGLISMGMIVSVNTNGSLIDEEWADFFAENRPRRVNITLYGANEETYENLCRAKGQFEKVMRGIKLLKERGVAVKMSGSLVPENEAQTGALLDISEGLDVPVNITAYMYPVTRERGRAYDEAARLSPEAAADRRFEILLRECKGAPGGTLLQLERMLALVRPHEPAADGHYPMRCRAGRSAAAVSWQGKMRPCVMLPYPEVDALSDGFGNAWRKLAEAVAAINTSSKCGTCEYRELCPVCVASALAEEGACDKAPGYLCRYTRHYADRIRNYVKEMNGHEDKP